LKVYIFEQEKNFGDVLQAHKFHIKFIFKVVEFFIMMNSAREQYFVNSVAGYQKPEKQKMP